MTGTTKTTDKAEAQPTPQHASLAAALAAVQSEIPSITKGATATVQTKAGGSYSYSYADLAVITPLILPLLGRNGLAWTTLPTMQGPVFVLHYTLAHEAGESIEGVYPLPDPLHGTPQEIGSAITYARRYALCAVTGVAPGGDDDDAAAANSKPAAGRQQQRPAAVVKPSRDWAAEAEKVTSLEALDALGIEAQNLGELGLKIGEDTVMQVLRARQTALEQPQPLAGAGKAEARAWLDEAKAFKYADEATALWREADALSANSRILDALSELASKLPERPSPESSEAGWAPVSDDTEPPVESSVLDETAEAKA